MPNRKPNQQLEIYAKLFDMLQSQFGESVLLNNFENTLLLQTATERFDKFYATKKFAVPWRQIEIKFSPNNQTQFTDIAGWC